MKYMGSKARIAKDICPIIQSFIDKSGAYIYVEIDKNKYLNVRISLLLKEQKYGRF